MNRVHSIILSGIIFTALFCPAPSFVVMAPTTRATWRTPRRSLTYRGRACAEAARGALPESSECADQPIVYRGLCNPWPARHWTSQNLVAALPEVRITQSLSGAFPRDLATDAQCPTQQMPMRELLQRIAKRSHPAEEAKDPFLYCHGAVLPESLKVDCPLPSTLAMQKVVARQSLWISGAGACSPLHYDLPNVLLCQLRGRKRIYLFSPAHHDTIKPRGSCFPGLTAQERIAQTRRAALAGVVSDGQYVELSPGDALLMPSGWWHEVESLADEDVGGSSHGGELDGCVISVGINWPQISDAIPSFAQWKDHVRQYPILTQGAVLAEFYGADKVAKMPGWEQLRDLSVFA